VGQSFGGGVAMQLAYQHPEYCDVSCSSTAAGWARGELAAQVHDAPASEYLSRCFSLLRRQIGNDVSRTMQAKAAAPRIGEMWNAYASLTESENRQSFIRTIRPSSIR